MTSLLEVKGLTRFYGSLKAVDDITFSLTAGTILGFIGPNGAGKSTTMRIIATLDVPTSGEVLLDGKSLVARPDQARPLLGYMPDRYGTYDDMTVFEFLDFFARAYRLRGNERKNRVESVMDFTGLMPLKDKLTSELSKGMKQRVALGRTLLHDPRLLILDEPADGLDPRARIELRELLRALARRAGGAHLQPHPHRLLRFRHLRHHRAGPPAATGTVQEVLSRTSGVAAFTEVELTLYAGSGVSLDEVGKKTERLLLEQPLVSHVSVLSNAIRFRLELAQGVTPGADWVEEASVRVLKALVHAGLPVTSFRTREHDLEDAFMSVTKGRVQ